MSFMPNGPRSGSITQRWILGGLALLFVLLALNPLMSRWAISLGERLVGHDLRVARFSTSWAGGKVFMRDVWALDPHDPDRRLVSAASVELDVETGALWRRQVHVRRGRVDGLKLDRTRHPGDAAHSNLAAAIDRDPRIATAVAYWLDQIGRMIAEGSNTQLASLPITNGAAQQWPDVCDRLEAKAVALHDTIDRLDDQLRSAGPNPLRNYQSYQQAVTDLEGASHEIFEVRSEGDRLRQQMKMDQAAIQEARQRDLAGEASNPLPLAMDPRVLSTYLLQDYVGQQVHATMEWLRWARRLLPTGSRESPRGTTRIFAGSKPSPEILVDTLVLRGDPASCDTPFRIEGTLTHLSSNPEWQAQPTELVLQTTGDVQTAIRATLDGRRPGGCDQIHVECPRWNQPERQLGDPNQLALLASAGENQWTMDLRLHQGVVAGSLVLVQRCVSFTPRLPENASRSLNAVVAESVRDIGPLEVAVTLSGSLDHPQWRIESPLGAALCARMAQVVAKEQIAMGRSQREASLERMAARVDELLDQVSRRQQRLDASLAQDDARIARLRAEVAQRVDHNDGIIDPSSPLRETLRR